MPSVPQTHTVEEVATALQKHPETIRRRIKSGEIKAFRLRKRDPWRIRADDLAELMSPNDDDPGATGSLVRSSAAGVGRDVERTASR